MRNLIYLSALLFIFSCSSTHEKPITLMPMSKLYDVTNPASWGGSVAATPDDDSDDDAIAINSAIAEAQKLLLNESNPKRNYQQLIYLPEGTYHLKSPVVIPKTPRVVMRHTKGPRSNSMAIWLMGQGERCTKLVAQSCGEWGDAENPKSVVQFAEYALDREPSSGNINFQLFATDFTIEVEENIPHVVGLSWGCANHGGTKNVTIRAAAGSGHTGFALVENNNGPGLIRNLTVEGFDIGVEIHDGIGETYGFEHIELKNQNSGGVALLVADKQIVIEGLAIHQRSADVQPIVASVSNCKVNKYGGFSHLILLGGEITCEDVSELPALICRVGHLYLRDVTYKNYAPIEDHGVKREYNGGEYIAVHGKTTGEKENATTAYNAPHTSLNLPIKMTPEVDAKVFELFDKGDYTIVNHSWLKGGDRSVSTSWVIVDPSEEADDTKLLQAAIESGAKYVGLLNHEPLSLSAPITIGDGVDMLFGYMADIDVAESVYNRKEKDTPNEYSLFTFTGQSDRTLFIKGIHFIDGLYESYYADFNLFNNDAARRVVFDDVRCKFSNKAYQNGANSYGQEVYFSNVELAYNGIYCDALTRFDKQKVWARQFNVECPIVATGERNFEGDTDLFYAVKPRILNRGSQIVVITTKSGEHNGVYSQVEDGGKSEHLGMYFNLSVTCEWHTICDVPNIVVKGRDSEISVVGQERIRGQKDTFIAPPHRNRYAEIYNSDGTLYVIKGTDLPTYMICEGVDPFAVDDYEDYGKNNNYRVNGLLRLKAR